MTENFADFFFEIFFQKNLPLNLIYLTSDSDLSRSEADLSRSEADQSVFLCRILTRITLLAFLHILWDRCLQHNPLRSQFLLSQRDRTNITTINIPTSFPAPLRALLEALLESIEESGF
jgi:hypothetical protein